MYGVLLPLSLSYTWPNQKGININ